MYYKLKFVHERQLYLDCLHLKYCGNDFGSLVLLFNINHLLGCLTHVSVIAAVSVENQRITFLQLRNDFLTVFYLHKRRLQRLNCKQDIATELFASNHLYGFLEDVVTKLVVDQLLHDEADAGLQALGPLTLVAKLIDDLGIVFLESSSEYLVDIRLVVVSVVA